MTPKPPSIMGMRATDPSEGSHEQRESHPFRCPEVVDRGAHFILLTVSGLGGIYHQAVPGMVMGLTLGLNIDNCSEERNCLCSAEFSTTTFVKYPKYTMEPAAATKW